MFSQQIVFPGRKFDQFSKTIAFIAFNKSISQICLMECATNRIYCDKNRSNLTSNPNFIVSYPLNIDELLNCNIIFDYSLHTKPVDTCYDDIDHIQLPYPSAMGLINWNHVDEYRNVPALKSNYGGLYSAIVNTNHKHMKSNQTFLNTEINTLNSELTVCDKYTNNFI